MMIDWADYEELLLIDNLFYDLHENFLPCEYCLNAIPSSQISCCDYCRCDICQDCINYGCKNCEFKKFCSKCLIYPYDLSCNCDSKECFKKEYKKICERLDKKLPFNLRKIIMGYIKNK